MSRSERHKENRTRSRPIVIVAARCGQTAQAFGLRFERSGEASWSLTWAFALKESAARREGYDRSEISGTMQLDPSYPGCPHCAKRTIIHCGSCDKVSCWDEETRVITCPWCKNRGELSGLITKLTSRNDA